MTGIDLRRIACWVAGPDPSIVPQAVERVIRRCLVDTIGVAIGGSQTDVVAHARTVAQQLSPQQSATVLGSTFKLSASQAAFVNSVAAHALDFDDNCYAGLVHGSAVIIPAAIAIAEQTNVDVAAMISAIVAGCEVEYALGEAVGNYLYERGWWTTTIFGPVGAAAATARLLCLDVDQTEAALSLALCQASGLKAAFGSDAKALLCGRASETGVVAALWAKEGATGPRDVLKHSRGFVALFAGDMGVTFNVEDIGQKWRLLNPGIDVKRIPVCLSSHTAVDAVLNLIKEHNINHEQIRSIQCNVPPVVIANLSYITPLNVQEAQFSMGFAIAASVIYPDFGLKHLKEQVFRNDEVRSLMQRVSMISGPEWTDPALTLRAPEGAFVRIETVDGRTLEGFCAIPRGSAVDPLSDEELSAKFMACCQELPLRSSRMLLDNLLNCDPDRPVRTLLELA